MLNKWIVIGRLVADPELRTTQNGKAVASFRIAVERDRTKEQKTDFFSCVAWSGTAEFISKWFKRGQLIALVGRAENREWQDKNGNKRLVTELTVSEAYFAGDKREDSRAGTNYAPAVGYPENDPTEPKQSDFEELIGDNELLPF